MEMISECAVCESEVCFLQLRKIGFFSSLNQDDRQHDHENFLATLLMSHNLRAPALVIRAFNVEIARVQDQTTDNRTAEFRLQFWTDALNKIFEKNQELMYVPQNPVAEQLYLVNSKYSLSKRNLERLITSRKSLLSNKFFKTLEDVEKYSENAVSSIYYLLLGVAGVKDLNADHAASHLGKAQGIANILRSIHVSNHHKTVTLPMDVLMKNKLSQEEVLRSVDDPRIRDVTFEIASRANSHLTKARNIKVPQLAKQILLPAVGVDQYLKKLEKFQFNIYEPKLRLKNNMLPFYLYCKKIVNKY